MASTLVSLISIFLFFFGSLPLRLYFSQIETSIILMVAATVYTFIKTVISKNAAQIDEFWSLLPIFYCFHLCHWTTRGCVMLALVIIWGTRLTYNFIRKGGFTGEEDYRWEHVRKIIPHSILLQIFNFIFVSLYNNLILFCISLPIYFDSKTDFELTDWLSTSLTLFFIVTETVADQQQWKFQSEKYKKIKAGEKVKKNFLDFGLFRYSRHPNFFSEISIWWSFYSFTKSFNVSVVGAIFLNLLFIGSTEFTEKLTVSKYPEYKEYQMSTSRLIPWFKVEKKIE